jgi:hypothetical protein
VFIKVPFAYTLTEQLVVPAAGWHFSPPLVKVQRPSYVPPQGEFPGGLVGPGDTILPVNVFAIALETSMMKAIIVIRTVLLSFLFICF